ncbi:hypothetical protein ACFYUV_20890 [Nonomuraea sp. NPDC003560]|uniref:hypothetical protein n=1 Tax=Nonomuraea sp. NPDC003560 TaxID=3364341 RepID=UPI0036C7350E
MSTRSERSTIARIAANTRWANEDDRIGATAKARNNSPASIEYWMKKVDPGNEMPRDQRLRRAENAKTAYYQQRMRAARAAKARKAAGEAAA